MHQCYQCGAALGEGDRFCRACGAATAAPDAVTDRLVGRLIGGAYEVLELVGVGGMGRVYRAEQRMLGRTVAIKVVHPHLLSDEQSVARFYTEAQAASRLNHPNSVSIIDFGRTDDGILYLVMEFLRGRDLARLVREDGLLPLPRACDLVRAVLDALAEAHALDMVHRDLKPENVIVERLRSGHDLVKVVDFGLAKLLTGGAEDAGITVPGLVCGTPDYMSPEQGRGQDVDARGDLYSVGVMLFELFTGRLPFAADTPTNVVLRHIQDPVPDPRDVAKDRGITEGLAKIVQRALQKRPADRYDSADVMADALRRAAEQLRSGETHTACTNCGHVNYLSHRFCANCGMARHVPASPASHPLSLPPRMHLTPGPGVLLARKQPLAEVAAVRARQADELATVAVGGEVGVGRTRFLAAVAELAAQEGELVVGAGPHPSGAPVPYHAIRSMVQSMLDTDTDGLAALRGGLLERAPLVAAGLDELYEPVGLRGAEGQSRAHAVAAALAHALRTALDRRDATRALIMIDDLNLCDGLTRQVIRALASGSTKVPATMMVVGQHISELCLPSGVVELELRALTPAEGRAVLDNEPCRSAREPDPDDDLLLPLYVEQLRELGLYLDGPRGTLPPRLADAISQRVARLPVGARRLLQAVAIWGNQCPPSAVERLTLSQPASNLALLTSRGLLVEHDGLLEVVHPFIRDLVEASIPAAARREFHRHALLLASEEGAPLEVRAHHAYGAGEPLGALVLLERMGDLALSRGDVDSAVLGYQRALELSRRELLETGDTYLEGAIENISRRLGRALIRRGDVVGAEGVLREALEFSAPTSTHRAHIQIGLSEVMASKQRPREAYRLLAQALEIAALADSEATTVDAQIAMARLRRAERDFGGAVAALAEAQQLLTDAEPDRLIRARVAAQLVQLQVDLRQLEAARMALPTVEQLAYAAEAPYLVALAVGLGARVCRSLGETAEAKALYHKAATLAEQAGDGPLSLRFRSLAGTVGEAEAAPTRPLGA